MEPGVPFALLAAAQLLAVAAAIGIGGIALAPRLRGLSSFAIVIGAAASAAADIATGADLGAPASNRLVLLRAAGSAFLAVGLLLLRRRPRAGRTAPAALSVAPLAAAPGPALLAVLAGLAAAGAAAVAGRRLRLPGWPLLAAGLGAGALAEALAPVSRHSGAVADTLLLLRAGGALCVLAGLALLGRSSVLSKVVAAIMAGTVLTAVATAGVVGTVVADQLRTTQGRQVDQSALGTLADLETDAGAAQKFASVLAACPDPVACARAETLFFSSGTPFTAEVSQQRVPRLLSGSLDPAALSDLAQQEAVTEALASPGFTGSGFILLRGRPNRLVALGVAAHRMAARPTASPPYVAVYGTVLGRARLRQASARSTFDSTVLSLPDAAVVASTLSPGAAAELAGQARADGLTQNLPGPGRPVVRFGQGRSPTAAYLLLQSGPAAVGLLVVSAPAAALLHTEQTVLELLFLALVAIGVVVSGVAVLLGQRVVDPVRKLTATAGAIAAGDVSARPAVRSRDEVGALADAFESMTDSLLRTAAELRRTGVEEAAMRLRLETVQAAMTDGLVVSDAAGTVTGVNPAAERLGAHPGQQLSELLRAPDGSPLRVPGEGVLAREGAHAAMVEIARSELPDGTGSVVVLRDVSTQRQAERMKTQFLANVSHELRTPLTPIRAYADMLQRRAGLTGAPAEYARQIGEAGRRLTQVVTLLVDVAALDAGRVVPEPRRVDVAPFIDERLAAWRGRAPGRAHDLRRRVSSALPAMLVDPQWLAKAFDELVDNAVKFSEPGSPIVLAASAAEDGARIRLSVRDSGCGVPEQARPAMFSDFEQLDGSATRTKDGLGLGLAFVRRVAAVTSLELSLDSAPGRGTLVSLDVPADGSVDSGAAGPPEQRRRAAPSRR